MQPSIISERLNINLLTTSDSKFIFELVNTAGWRKYIGERNVYSHEDSLNYIKKIIDNPDITYWVVRHKQNDIPIGIISLVKRSYLTHPDIGFAFLPSFANNGYAYEAAKAALHHIINNREHSHILGVTIRNNMTSIKLLTKLGLAFEKEIEFENEKLQVYKASTDKLHVSAITHSFFSAFTNKGDAKPSLDTLNDICIRQVLIINKKNSGIDIYNLASFTEPRKKMLTDGTLIEFEEKEIYEETKIFTNLAHRYSEYEKTGILDGSGFKRKGIKLFQFIKTDQVWKISSVIWEDHENYY